MRRRGGLIISFQNLKMEKRLLQLAHNWGYCRFIEENNVPKQLLLTLLKHMYVSIKPKQYNKQRIHNNVIVLLLSHITNRSFSSLKSIQKNEKRSVTAISIDICNTECRRDKDLFTGQFPSGHH